MLGSQLKHLLDLGLLLAKELLLVLVLLFLRMLHHGQLLVVILQNI